MILSGITPVNKLALNNLTAVDIVKNNELSACQTNFTNYSNWQ